MKEFIIHNNGGSQNTFTFGICSLSQVIIGEHGEDELMPVNLVEYNSGEKVWDTNPNILILCVYVYVHLWVGTHAYTCV